jgi:hypothetical protein
MPTTPTTTSWPSAGDLVGIDQPSDDDVPTTLSGEPLDTAQKLRTFLEKLNADSKH